MPEKVLIVDDEPRVLEALEATLGRHFDVTLADSQEKALALVREESFVVMVSDMQMPGMDGLALLSEVKKESPETVRMMLTGLNDQDVAISAINKADVFRFLRKPVRAPAFKKAIEEAIAHYRLVAAERDLLENTLQGSINALVETLSLISPELFGRGMRLKARVKALAKAMDLPDAWQWESAALLSAIGCINLPPETVRARFNGEPLQPDQEQKYLVASASGADLLGSIPRLEALTDAIRYQEKYFDGSGYPEDNKRGSEIPLGARLLRPLADMDAIETAGNTAAQAWLQIKNFSQRYDPDIFQAIGQIVEDQGTQKVQSVSVSALTDNMILASDLYTSNGSLLVSKGQSTTAGVRRHLLYYLDENLIGPSVEIVAPDETDEERDEQAARQNALAQG
jgi:response regulator RpfG family c-di-GMP phosphodiesterase